MTSHSNDSGSRPSASAPSTDTSPATGSRRSLFFVIAPVIFVCLAVIGLWTTYSPVPHWDMWDGYLLFFTRQADGDWSQWFARHNEHRLILSRLLFWIDISWFGGAKLFLLACNLLFFAMLVGVMVSIARMLELRSDLAEKRYTALIGVIVVLGFSWIQNVNFTWAFQSQFLTAYLLPLGAFYTFYLATVRSRSWLVVSLLLGIMAAGTMANGVLTLFVLFVLSLLLRSNRLVSVLILLLAVGVVTLYFSGSRPPSGEGGLLSSVVSAPLTFLGYLLAFLGNPFYYMLFRIDFIEIPFGLAFIALTLWWFYKTLTDPALRRYRPLLLVLFAFIGYVAVTAALIASGRTAFGIDTANTSRYTTPTVYAWIALLLIGVRIGGERFPKEKTLLRLFMAVTILLLPDQLKTLKYDRERLDDQMLAALALELNVNDPLYIRKTFPGPEYLLEKVARARELNIAVFGHPAIRDAGERIGQTEPVSPEERASVYPSAIEPLEKGDLRIEGWICVAGEGLPRLRPLVLIRGSRVVGYALTRSEPEGASHECDPAEKKRAVFIAGYLKEGDRGRVPPATADQKLFYHLLD